MSKLKKVLIWALALYVIGLGLVSFFQHKIIFQPKKLSQEYIFEFEYPFEEIFIETNDGERLNAIYFKNKNPKGVILYFHGNKGCLSKWGNITSFFAKKEYDVIVMDYRGYGKSTGAITEENLYADAQLFYDYVLEKYAEDQIVVYGRSLGTAIATKVASTNKPRNLVLETPYNTMEEVTSHWLPIFPVKQILQFRFPSNQFIQKVQCPITIFHGTKDGVIPYGSAKRLFESIPISNKRMITIEGGSHNDLMKFDKYTKTIGEVLSKKI
ncbi:alpha/beta hydrolase [Aquimarina sp. SS2-1]|uniref:alpha/beta hydrolase n=1 Tax=Aquimarina besae TaxID=3342247 RepID=UPI00366A5D2A